ncbi:MAG TPA: fimbrial assembly protein [Cyanobacteria bacterium UBA8803]|nr:fimbrial assembly protein [Cyanobacteria bacterium UBA9273]HBL62051.1 fimbrial assembly protein [Cyanobacteria bacterium UBA8803]
MYSLDINFLKDRPDYHQQTQGKAAPKKSVQMEGMTPLILGVVVGLLLPGAVGGFWLYLQQQNAQLTQQIADVDAQLGALKAQEAEIGKLNTEIKNVRTETTALATVFNQIKPWSAILQDVRERTPAGVQIKTIQQTETLPTPAPSAAPSPAASPAATAAPADPNASLPTINLEIAGTARSFDDVNYFLLTLQQSPFVQNEGTELVSAQLVANPTKLEVPKEDTQKQSAAKITYELPKVVDYKIKTTLNNVPASELLREIDRKGAVGLVTRIRTLEQITQEQNSKTGNPAQAKPQTQPSTQPQKTKE